MVEDWCKDPCKRSIHSGTDSVTLDDSHWCCCADIM